MGEGIFFNVLIYKLKQIWYFVFGDVFFIRIGNGLLLIKFFSAVDKDFIWVICFWFVSGMNFCFKVLEIYVLFFEIEIDWVD